MALTKISTALQMKAWAKDTWQSGLDLTFFKKFMGSGSDSIIQIRNELQKGKGDTINIPLCMPLKAAGIHGDNTLEGFEEELIYRDFNVAIDQIRNAVRIAGKFEEQKTQINMRQDAKTALARWLSTLVDKMIFTELSTSPSADRTIYGGNATSIGSIVATNKFTAELIGKAKRVALADERTMIKPVNINGADTYVMVIDQYQARDLKADQKWLDAQQNANIRGEKNPIFSGALGMYDGVVVHESNRVVREAAGSGSGANRTMVSHGLFLGTQAAVFAVGNNPTWNEKMFDYDNQVGFAFGRIFGIKKAEFDYGTAGVKTDFGVINVLTSSQPD